MNLAVDNKKNPDTIRAELNVTSDLLRAEHLRQKGLNDALPFNGIIF